MSNYIAPAINPKTGKVEQAEFLDNFYGRWQYGVRFPDGRIYRAHEVSRPDEPAIPSKTEEER